MVAATSPHSVANGPVICLTQSRRTSPIRTFAPAIAWALVIFATSCRYIDRDTFVRFTGAVLPSGSSREIWTSIWQAAGLLFVKGYHVFEFALLTLLVHSGLPKLKPERRTFYLALSAAASTSYAALDEWHQTFVPGRGGRVSYVAIDFIGIGLAMILIIRRQEKTSANTSSTHHTAGAIQSSGGGQRRATLNPARLGRGAGPLVADLGHPYRSVQGLGESRHQHGRPSEACRSGDRRRTEAGGRIAQWRLRAAGRPAGGLQAARGADRADSQGRNPYAHDAR